jgi:hypothetical protein
MRSACARGPAFRAFFALIHRSAWNRFSRKFTYEKLHIRGASPVSAITTLLPSCGSPSFCTIPSRSRVRTSAVTAGLLIPDAAAAVLEPTGPNTHNPNSSRKPAQLHPLGRCTVATRSTWSPSTCQVWSQPGWLPGRY